MLARLVSGKITNKLKLSWLVSFNILILHVSVFVGDTLPVNVRRGSNGVYFRQICNCGLQRIDQNDPVWANIRQTAAQLSLMICIHT